jgi:hypothetical protein
MLKDFTACNSWELGESDEVNADEAMFVTSVYEGLVKFMEEEHGHERSMFEPEPGCEPAVVEVEVEVKKEPENLPEIVTNVARIIVSGVEDFEIDDPDRLRLAAEYLTRASMAMRDMSREEIESTDAATLAQITDNVIAEAKENYPEIFEA